MSNRKLIINIVISLTFGMLFYYIFSPDVIFVKKLDEITSGGFHIDINGKSNFLISFIRNYALDMIWAYSLVYALFLFTDKKLSELIGVIVVAFIFSTTIEFLQLTKYVKGTFDIYDVVLEAVAEIIAFTLIRINLEDKKYEKKV